MTTELDTFNEFAVGGTSGDRLVILLPPREPISKDRALRLAAWLVTLAANDKLFADYVKAIRGT